MSSLRASQYSSPAASQLAAHRPIVVRHDRQMAVRPQAVAAPEAPAKASPIILHGQVLHSIEPARLELFNSMHDFAAREVLPLLKPVDKCWQPQDFLPDPESPDFMDQVSTARGRVTASYGCVGVGSRLVACCWACACSGSVSQREVVCMGVFSLCMPAHPPAHAPLPPLLVTRPISQTPLPPLPPRLWTSVSAPRTSRTSTL
jgi:hypothetical protein